LKLLEIKLMGLRAYKYYTSTPPLSSTKSIYKKRQTEEMRKTVRNFGNKYTVQK